jgi:hypothetical protein
VDDLAPVAHRLQRRPVVVAQPEVEALARGGALQHLGVALELVPDGGADEVAAIGVEAVLDEQVDMAEIDITEIERELLALAAFRSPRRAACRHRRAIL